MKSLKLFLGAVLGMGLIVCTSGMSFAVCLDLVGACNDLEVYSSDDQSGQLVSVYGYEYGCDVSGRAFTGVLIKSSTARQYILTGNWNNAFQVAAFNLTIEKATKTGDGYYSFNEVGGGSNGSITVALVPCPAAGVQALEIVEPDVSQQ